jgi:hypothetical protein
MSAIQELVRHISAIAPLPFNETTEPVVVASNTSQTILDRVECDVEETTRRQTLAFDEMVAFDPNADALWPGAIVQGRSLRDGILAPIALPRAPLAITVTTPFDLPAISRTVQEPSLASVTEAIRALLAPAEAATPARMTFLCKSASSLEQGLLSIGCDIKWLTGSVRADMTARVSASESLVIARLMQAYYTVACAPPASPAALLAESVTLAELAPYLGEGNPPAYLSSVTFGRALLFAFQSRSKSIDLQASVNAAFGGVVKGTGESEVHHKRALESSQMQVLAIGGAAQHAAEVVGGGRLEAVRDYVRAGATFSRSSPGVPISFQARYLRDNTSAGMTLSTSWTQRTIRGRDIEAVTPFKVGPRSGVVDTKIVVRAGDKVRLSSSEQVWSGVVATGWCDGNGWSTWDKPGQHGFPMMDRHPFALIGRIDEKWFFIGTGTEITYQGSTETLKLRINTNNHGVGDGELKVTVAVQRRAER